MLSMLLLDPALFLEKDAMDRRADDIGVLRHKLQSVSVVINSLIAGCVIALFVLVIAIPKG